MYDDERYVIADVSEDDPARYRLLATGKTGAKFVWARRSELEKMLTYITPDDDTSRY